MMRTMTKTAVAFLLAASPLAAGCGTLGAAASGSISDASGLYPELGPTTAVPGSIGMTAAGLATSAPLAPPAAPKGDAPTTAPAEARQVVYSASYRVVVADVAGTIRSVQQSAERVGGYMQEVAGGSITIRVPANRFDETVKVIEAAGEVTDRQIRAQDVTEEMKDLDIRLENAEKLRQRLLAILAKADKVEDAMKVEAELARVSAEVDGYKGKLRFLASRVAMATIRVDLNSPVVQNARGTGPRLPFDWVENLGDGLVAGEVQQMQRKAGFLSRGPRFVPPAGFVRYYEEASQVDAMDGSGLLVRVIRRANVDKAPLTFWAKLARRSLVEGRSLAVTAEEGDANYHVIRGTREVGGKTLGYLLTIKRSDKGVAVFEAWGPKDLLEPQVPALRASAVTADPD